MKREDWYEGRLLSDLVASSHGLRCCQSPGLVRHVAGSLERAPWSHRYQPAILSASVDIAVRT